MITLDDAGLYCERLGLHVDPTKPVPRAVFTSERRRIEGCGEEVPSGVTFHASGFSPGTRQVRIEAGGEVWVVTGDFKRSSDPLVAPFEAVRCDGLVIPAEFGLPIFRWDDESAIAEWLSRNESCTLFASPVLALRLQAQLAGLRRHEDLEPLARRWEELGAPLPPSDPGSRKGIAPLAARAGIKRPGATALAAGTARIRGPRRRSNFDTGFAVSEHADWPQLLRTVEETGARKVLVRGAHAEPLARFLREERGLQARAL